MTRSDGHTEMWDLYQEQKWQGRITLPHGRRTGQEGTTRGQLGTICYFYSWPAQRDDKNKWTVVDGRKRVREYCWATITNPFGIILTSCSSICVRP